METIAKRSHQLPTKNQATLQYMAAACAFLSQAIHLWVLPGELVLSILSGLFFFTVAVGQGLLGVSLLFHPGKWAYRLGILLNSIIVLTLVAMHMISLPNITGAHQHSLGLLEVTAAFSEILLIFLLVKLYSERV